MTAPPFIKITCQSGRIGKFWWHNSTEAGFFPRYGQPETILSPGQCGWDEMWPDAHPWPIRSWGKCDLDRDGWAADFDVFERWMATNDQSDQLGDLDIMARIALYSLCVDAFYSGIDAGRNPWRLP
jgi:hypothetical protein